MKNIILTTLLVAISSCLVAQNYLTEDAVWKQLLYVIGTPLHVEYIIEKDTVIGNNTYYKIRGSAADPSYEESYYAYLRESSGVFYEYYPSGDRVLHNFNLSVGDTVASLLPNENITVTYIDTIYFGNMPRKRFFLDNYQGQGFGSPSYLIEGIGSSSGLVHQPYDGTLFDGGAELLCFAQGGQYISIKQDSVSETHQMESGCNSLVSIDGLEIPDFQFQISPNPAQNHLNITFDKILSDNTHIRIASIDGKMLLQKNISNVQQINNLNISQLPDGVLIISVISDEILHSKRIIKMK